MLGRRQGLLLAMVAALSQVACATVEAPAVARQEPVKIEKIAGTDLSRLTLQARAAERIGLETEKVEALQPVGEQERLVVPYGAVLYDAKGATWVYTNPEPLVFVRHAVTVERFEGDVAVLRGGPPVGTSVVTDGGSELTGVEFGVGK